LLAMVNRPFPYSARTGVPAGAAWQALGGGDPGHAEPRDRDGASKVHREALVEHLKHSKHVHQSRKPRRGQQGRQIFHSPADRGLRFLPIRIGGSALNNSEEAFS